ncbi:MAG TPA: hypothetical protein VFT83_00560, partial [Nitrososphaeraceae archaeon]|nr:hypothetical protein [Nitrososphaeraceae archaeon]
PEIVAEIKFSDWTRDNIMKSPIFLRLREDKKPEECFIEKERYTKKVIETRIKKRSSQNANVTTMNAANNSHNDFNNHAYSYFSNLDKVYWNKTSTHRQFTKKDLIEYYDKISKYILPYLKDRPLSLSRYPDGIKGKSFYQKNWDQNKPSFVQTVKIYSKSEDEGVINYVLCNNKETLLWLANLGCIEIHPWYSRITDFDEGVEEDNTLLYPEKCSLNFPDFIIFDLDPYIFLNVQDNVTNQKEPEYSLKGFKATAEVALGLKELFDELKIQSYVKTSGKTGLHILVPIDNLYTYDQTRSFARIIGSSMTRRYPNKITMEWDTSKRNDKVFFDYNQNSKGKTIASIFSARPVESAAVSFPINWEDLLDVDPTDFMLLNVPDLLESNTHNAWSNMMENKQNLNEILEKASHVL